MEQCFAYWSATHFRCIHETQPHQRPSLPIPERNGCQHAQQEFRGGTPDYVIVGNLMDDKGLWETHPLLPRYQLAFNLGYRIAHLVLTIQGRQSISSGSVGSTSGTNTGIHKELWCRRFSCSSNWVCFGVLMIVRHQKEWHPLLALR